MLRQHPIPEDERIQRIEDMLSQLKSGNIKIPIIRVVDLLYNPTGTYVDALVASPDFTEQDEGNLVYVESGSQHGMLSLADLSREPATGLFGYKKARGFYDRDPETRRITGIYLEERDIMAASYFGTLADLLDNPNISRRNL